MANISEKTGKMTRLAILVAVTLIMAFTPLGYLRTAGMEISFLMIPVVVGAVVLGPTEGAILGGVFGLTSFSTCFTGSLMGSQLLNINPVFTFIVCVVPRVLAGWLPGLLFRALTRKKDPLYAYGAAALSGAVLNTVLFMGSLCLFFYGSDYIQGMVAQTGAANPIVFIAILVGVQGLIEAGVCFIVGAAISKALRRFARKGAQRPGAAG